MVSGGRGSSPCLHFQPVPKTNPEEEKKTAQSKVKSNQKTTKTTTTNKKKKKKKTKTDEKELQANIDSDGDQPDEAEGDLFWQLQNAPAYCYIDIGSTGLPANYNYYVNYFVSPNIQTWFLDWTIVLFYFFWLRFAHLQAVVNTFNNGSNIVHFSE